MAKETTAKEKNASHAGGREAARQQQASTQSIRNPSEADDQRSDANTATQTTRAIGSTVGQERVSDDRRNSDSQRPSAGTPDLPRERATDGDIEREGGVSQDSLVSESTGAFKERP